MDKGDDGHEQGFTTGNITEAKREVLIMKRSYYTHTGYPYDKVCSLAALQVNLL